MSTKKKLVISLSVAAAIIVCAVVALVAVFAAQTSSTVSSDISINFSAVGVGCEVKGSYAVAANVPSNYTAMTGGDGGTLTLGANTTSGSLTVTNGVTLQKDTPYVVFKYEFKNTGSNEFVITLNDTYITDTANNLEYKNFKDSYTDFESDTDISENLKSTYTGNEKISVTSGSTVILYTVIKVKDTTVNLASGTKYSPTWTLTSEN